MLGTFLLPTTSLNFCFITLFVFVGLPTLTKNLSALAGVGGLSFAVFVSAINLLLLVKALLAAVSDL